MRGADPAGVCGAFLEAHFRAQPEVASFLGCEEHDARLGEPSGAELGEVRGVLAALEAIDQATLDDDTRLDVDAALRVARFEERYLAHDRHAENLELALLPHAAIQHASLHGYGASERIRALPDFLSRHAENLRRGMREERTPDRDVAIAFADHLLPAAARAHDVYASFARFVAEEIVPAARADVRLGADEVRFRLREVMGIDATPDELLASAHAELARVKDRVAGVDVPSLLARRGARYDDHVREATAFVRERAIVDVPEDLALAFEPLPPGIADGSAVTNWPPRLAQPHARGHVLVSPDPEAHAAVASRALAVHEGIPGHYLQCAIWQRAFATGESPRRELVRYLPLHDDAALARGNMATMPAVEGWAVHMERTLLRHGFFASDDEQAFFAVCDAIRAARVVLDLELQAGDRPAADLARFVADATRMPPRWAEAQVLRARRMPLQGLCYLTGALAIEALEASLDATPAAFHRALLALGPVPPSRARNALAA
jgi:uncharacterized protein (DUF885 family)